MHESRNPMDEKSQTDLVTYHLVISGRVQGVFFRDSMRREAQNLGVTGWVRNRRDGSVEAIVQGAQAAVTAILDWAHHGPPAANVDSVTIESIEGEYHDFFITT